MYRSRGRGIGRVEVGVGVEEFKLPDAVILESASWGLAPFHLVTRSGSESECRPRLAAEGVQKFFC